MQTRTPHRLATLLLDVCGVALFAVSLAQVSSAGPPSSDGPGTLIGHVHCREDRHAEVLVIRNGLRIASAEIRSDGTFLLAGVPAGRHTLLVRGDYCGSVERPVTVRPGEVETIEVDLSCPPIPCPKLDRSDPGCIFRSPEQRAKVGSACPVHPKSRLLLDIVPIHFGFVSFRPAGGDEARQFPNARVVYSAGCVMGVERWAEVAYCPECRRAFYWHNPLYVLHPIQPAEVRREEK